MLCKILKIYRQLKLSTYYLLPLVMNNQCYYLTYLQSNIHFVDCLALPINNTDRVVVM